MPRACAMMSPIGQSLSSRRYSTAKSASTKCVIGSTGSPDRIDDRTPNRCCGLVSPRSANLGLGVSNLDVVWQLCSESSIEVGRVTVHCPRHGVKLEHIDPALSALDLRRSEEHTYEIQSLIRTSYSVFLLKKKNNLE